MQSSTRKSDRRDWLRGAARVLTLGALGGGAAVLLARSGLSRAGGCPQSSGCAGCPMVQACTLPERLPEKSEEPHHE